MPDDHRATYADVVQEKLYYLIALSLHSGRLRHGDFGTYEGRHLLHHQTPTRQC
jgi:hypothetical protein